MFSSVYRPFVYLLQRNVYSSPFLNWVVSLLLSCRCSLYILDVNPYQIYDFQISIHSVPGNILSALQILIYRILITTQ